MEELVFECETVTPMFCYGADGETPEIRAQSIKGLLRFWWRAMQNLGDSKSLFQKESEIFGHSSNNEELVTRAKCPFSIQVIEHGEKTKNKSIFSSHRETFTRKKGESEETKNYTIDTFAYLAYGLYSTEGVKEYFVPEVSGFTVKFRIYRNCNFVKNELIKAMYLLSEHGGIGAKSRNGFGAFRITDASEQLKMPKLEKILNSEIKPYAAFCKESKIWKTQASLSTWEETLSIIAKAYITAKWQIEGTHVILKRQFITQPIKAKDEIGRKLHLNRKSKPYFLHIKKIKKDEFTGSILLLPSLFHDNNAKYNGDVQGALGAFSKELDSMKKELERMTIL